MSQLIFNKPVEHITKPQEYEISSQELVNQISPLGIEKVYLWDYWYYYISLEDWGKILKDVLVGMPEYTTEKFDCENFSMLTAARVSERYKINTCGIAIGQSPFGEHGYNILFYEGGFIYFEPQTADYIPVDDGSYKARTVIFG